MDRDTSKYVEDGQRRPVASYTPGNQNSMKGAYELLKDVYDQGNLTQGKFLQQVGRMERHGLVIPEADNHIKNPIKAINERAQFISWKTLTSVERHVDSMIAKRALDFLDAQRPIIEGIRDSYKSLAA